MNIFQWNFIWNLDFFVRNKLQNVLENVNLKLVAIFVSAMPCLPSDYKIVANVIAFEL